MATGCKMQARVCQRTHGTVAIHTIECIMFRLIVHDTARADLAAIEKVSQEDHDLLVVLLEEFALDRSLLDHFAEDGEWTGRSLTVDVTPFAHLQKQKFDLWRIKTFLADGSTFPYRIIYAVHNLKFDYYVFAIMRRNPGSDYEKDHQLIKRLRDVYLELGLPFVSGNAR